MFGLGMGEVVIILVLALLLLGPQRLPDAAKQIGKGLREFRKATEDLKSQFESELYATDDKPSKPKLVTPAADAAAAGGAAQAATGEVPRATAENVPGIDVALFEVKAAPSPASAAAVVAEQAPSPSQPSVTAKAS